LELQQELQEVRQQCTQFQKQLTEVVDEKEQLEESFQKQLKEQWDQHQQKLQEVRQQRVQFQQQLHEVERLQARLQQQLREQQDQHRQEKIRFQQEVREARQQLHEAADERQQFQARVETAVAFIRGDPLTTQVGFDAIELWEVPREDVQVSNKILGTGGWGYVAEGTFRGQKVAVKCLHRGILSQFTTNHVRREISIMAQVRHPNLVLLIGAVLNADTGPLIITELLDRTLRSTYEDHALEERCKFPILRDVASALNYLHAHRRPIIHRDVSSSNILLLSLCNGNWLAKLSDFGSANLIRAATTPAEGAVIYSAPEVSTDQRLPQTTKVDVYSFGVLICEVTLCRLPPDPKDFPAFLDTLERDADDRIHQLAKNCTKRNPDKRLTMQEVLKQIDQFL
jgi:ubiquitin thioesterase CYLD